MSFFSYCSDQVNSKYKKGSLKLLTYYYDNKKKHIDKLHDGQKQTATGCLDYIDFYCVCFAID